MVFGNSSEEMILSHSHPALAGCLEFGHFRTEEFEHFFLWTSLPILGKVPMDQ
jgi:hypothetical protein